jgi:outer membrane protein insertion porin family
MAGILPLRGNMSVRASSTCRAVLVALLLLVPGTAAAQEDILSAERPRVMRISFPGAEALDERVLRSAILTEPSSCRGFLLQPFCWLTDWHVLVRRSYLDREELERDELRLRVLYFRRGFREAEVYTELLPRGKGVEVAFHVEEGPPTVLEELRIVQTQEVLGRRAITRAGLPVEGEPLNLVALDTALANLALRLGDRGYMDGEVRDSIAISPDGRRAWGVVNIEPGRRATVSEFAIEGNEQVDDRTIRDALRLRSGRVLRNRDIVASQRSLYESNLFHEARVDLPEQPDSAKVLEITVREAPPRSIRVGGGFNTIEFLQAESRFTHYNWYGRGRRLDLRGTVGNLLAAQLNDRGPFQNVVPEIGFQDEGAFLRPTWLVSAELMQPAFVTAENAVGLGLFSHRRTIPGIAIDQGFGANLSFTRRLDYRTPVSATYRFERAAVEAGDLYFCVNYVICDRPTIEAVGGPHRLSPVGLSYNTDRGNIPLGPTTGYRARLDLEHASSLTQSDFSYFRISGETSRYIPLGVPARRVVAGRLRVGWVRPLEGSGGSIGLEEGEEEGGPGILHPRKRFYAGGSRSVRGYWENQLGPRILTVPPQELLGENGGCTAAEISDASCDPSAAPASAFRPRPLGGTSVLEGSVEFRFPLYREFRGAVFLDGAVVGERVGGLFTEGTSAITPGVGARMDTPVGPLRVDLGVRPGITETLAVITEHVDENGERRLIRLEQPRRWNPVEADARGFLGRVLAHLTLHLSIGEAY